MSGARSESVEARWARLGVAFNCAPALATPDVERLLIDTAREVSANARLLPSAVTWLCRHGPLVARHRLARLAAEEGDVGVRAALGLLIDAAVDAGAPRALSIVSAACTPARTAGPLALASRGSAALGEVSRRHASRVSLRWGLWAPPVELRLDAVRPAWWVMEHNPSLRDRALRRGDLRTSIMESLRRARARRVDSAAQLTRLCGATRAAVRKALRQLVAEGEVVVEPRPGSRRDKRIRLRRAA